MNIYKVLNNQLAKPSHIVKVEDKNNGLRLKKESAIMRYAYSQNDILNEFGTIESFINYLQKQGYENTTFLIQRTYGDSNKTTYHTMKEVTVNLLENNHNNAPAMIPNTPAPQPDFLGNPLDKNMQFLGAMVQSERAGDYLKRISELEEDIKDYRSKNRRLEEDNHRLKLKVDTSEERAELKLQKELLDKKSVFESDGFQKIAEGLGGLIPHVVPALLNKGAAPTAQLGAPETKLSPVKVKTIELLKAASDDDTAFIAYVLQNMSKELVSVLQNHIQNNN